MGNRQARTGKTASHGGYHHNKSLFRHTVTPTYVVPYQLPFNCESHPDLHAAACDFCYSLSPLQKLRKVVRATMPKIRLKKKYNEGCHESPVSSMRNQSVRLVSFRSCSDAESNDSGFDASHGGSKNSLLSDGTSASSSSTGSATSTKRWNRGRSEKRWKAASAPEDHSGSPHVTDYKTVWPVTIKESLFLPEYPVKTTSTRNNNYDIVEQISHGKFSNVAKIRMRRTGELFALKCMSKDNIIRSQAVNQAKVEALIQKSCSHPFLVSAVATWQTRGHLYIVTNYVPGGDLASIWHEFGAFPEPVVQVWGAEIAMALQHLHTCGIIFRDLKLGNILVAPDGHLKISDFGLARYSDAEYRALTICGTLNYMAPEVLLGHPYNFSTDWWSFGIVLYALLVGRYPLQTQVDHVLMGKTVMKHQYFGNDKMEHRQLSFLAVHLLERLLRKDPAKRLRNFQLIRTSGFFCGINFAHVFRKAVTPFALKNFAHFMDHARADTIDSHKEDEFAFME